MGVNYPPVAGKRGKNTVAGLRVNLDSTLQDVQHCYLLNNTLQDIQHFQLLLNNALQDMQHCHLLLDNTLQDVQHCCYY